MATVSFTRMADGTYDDYQLILGAANPDRGWVVDKVFGFLGEMTDPEPVFQIDRLQHSLQTATRALRDDADEEAAVCALLHDIGDEMTPDNHGEFAASILRPYVSDQNYWIIKNHAVFQGYYYFHHLGFDRNARDQHRDHPHFDACAHFCEAWDQESFDPAYDAMTLDAFEPMVRRIFERTPWSAV